MLSLSLFTQPAAKVDLSGKMTHRNNYDSTTRCCGILDALVKNFKFLQPVSPNDQSENQFYHGEPVPRLLNDQGMEVLRGGIVRAMAAWEALVVDLLREAFNKLIESAENLEDMKTKWGPFRIKKALDKALKQRCIDNEKSDESLSVLETLSPKDDWRRLLKYHLDHTLDKDVRPVFCSNKGIGQVVADLFIVKNNSMLDLTINDSFPQKVEFYVKPDHPTVVEVYRRGLRCCSLLYYGFQCVLAHGIPNKTLESGVLKDFDEMLRQTPETKKLKFEDLLKDERAKIAFGVRDARKDDEVKRMGYSKYKQAEILLSLRNNIENFASGAHISYQTWRNMCLYLKESAIWLDKAIDELIRKLPNDPKI